MSSPFYCPRPVKSLRKFRRCWWCQEPMPVGSSGVRESGTNNDGDFGTFYWHTECHAAFKSMTAEESDGMGFDEGIDCGMFKRGTKELQ